MFKPISIILLFFVLSNKAISQKSSELGAEYMRSIGKGFNNASAGARYESYSKKNSWSIGFTYILPSKHSYGGQRGLGMYAGFRFGFGGGTGGNLFAGARVSFAFVNFEGKTNLNSLVCTAMAEVGYHFLFSSKKNIFASPSIGYGYTKKITKEFNSLDEDEGGRIMPSISAGFRL